MVAVGAAGSVLALAACGSSPTPATPGFVQELKAPPATVPADYTSVAAITHQLQGVATCTANGPMSAICTLVTAEMNTAEISNVRPFQVKVFGTPAQTEAYLGYVRGLNVTYAKDGSAVRQALTGPHWVVTPQTESTGLTAGLKPYLGGTLTQ